MGGINGNGINLQVHNEISSIDIVYLIIFILSILLIIYGVLRLSKDCFGRHTDDRGHDEGPDKKTRLIKHPSSYV